jgi:hypothetical protein
MIHSSREWVETVIDLPGFLETAPSALFSMLLEAPDRFDMAMEVEGRRDG